MNRLPPLRTYSSPSSVAVVRIAAEPLAGRELRQVALLLLLAPRQLQPQRPQLLRGDDQSARGAHLGDLLDRHEREQRGRAQASVLLVVEDPEDLVLPEELDDVPGELRRLVDLGRAGRDPLPRQLADQVTDLALLVAERVLRHRPESSPAKTTDSRSAAVLIASTRARATLRATPKRRRDEAHIHLDGSRNRRPDARGRCVRA